MDFGAQASFVLQDNPADGDYIISLGNGADTSEVKKIKFTVGGSEEEYPFYASFKKNDDNSLRRVRNLQAQCRERCFLCFTAKTAH